MALTKNDLMNELFDAALITLSATAVTVAVRKLVRCDLGIPATPQGVVKMTAAIGGGSLLVQYLQNKKFLPDDPFKTA